jgi:hypothetical protein
VQLNGGQIVVYEEILMTRFCRLGDYVESGGGKEREDDDDDDC